MMQRILHCLALFLIFLNSSKCLAKVVSCEGFVKTEFQQILSKLRVKLFTSSGNLKYETECNAQNGYFLIPVYNKGKYEIRISAPDGWIFGPESNAIQISGEGGCEKDIIFNQIGFEIAGNVLKEGGESLMLGLYEDHGNLVAKTHVDVNGKYKFVAKPGKYLISTMDDAAQCVQRGSATVQIENAPVNVKPDIKIAGHNLKVIVVDEQGQRVNKVVVNLHSPSPVEFENLPKNVEKPKLIETKNSGLIYSLETNTEGFVVFPCFPAATYRLNAEMKKGNFEILYESKTIRLNSKTKETVVLAVTGFNINGHALTPLGNPIPDVSINLDGTKRAITTIEGKFLLKDVGKGSHEISAGKEHYEFETFKKEFSSKMDTNIELKAIRIAICGTITPGNDASLEIINAKGNELIEVFRPNNGKFCRMLNPSHYIIRISSNLAYTPSQIEVNLAEKPFIDINFSQFKAKITGKVDSFEKANNIEIVLLKDNRTIISKKTLSKTGEFGFIDIPPSSYRVRIIDTQNIWWDTTDKEIEIVDKDVSNLLFKQKGYQIQIHSTHTATLKYFSSQNDQGKLVEFAKGENTIYFANVGKYNFVVNSCHEFAIDGIDQKDTFTIPSATPITFTAVKTLVPFTVKLVESDPTVKITLKGKTTDIEKSTTQILDSSDGTKTFLFQLDQNEIAQEYLVTPYSARHLFVPESIPFIFDGDCREKQIDFKTQFGKFIEGKVVPALSDVKVVAVKGTKNDEKLSTKTDENGKYKIGPVWELKDWVLEMVKEGYEFTRDPTNPYVFTSTKLSQLFIYFVDIDTRDPLADVLVSVSGESLDFRSNIVTDPSGKLSFVGLVPGKYFIRPILQEYKFNTNSFEVTVREGQTQEMTLEAKRFEFSLFGKVSSLGSKLSRVAIFVEALSPQCENHQQEDAVDSRTGGFRVRGLKPSCHYQVFLKREDGNRIKAFPPIFDIQTGNQDRHDLNFVVLPLVPPEPTLLGELEVLGNATFGKFRIFLSENGNVLQEQIVHATVFFFVLPGYNRHYSIGLDRNEAKRMKIEPVSVEFFANSSFTFIRLISRAEQRSSDIEVNKANYLGLALIILITLAFLNQSKTKLIVENIDKTIRSFIKPNNSQSATTNAVGMNERKRR